MNEGYTKVFVSLDGTEQQDFVLARAIKVAAPQVSVLRLKAMPELTRMFGNWQMMTKVSTMKM